jgi:hypothetical protein
VSSPIRVVRVEELPPGQGLFFQLGAREIAIYNLEGRFHARFAGGRGHSPPESGCQRGRRFDALAADSPVRSLSAGCRTTVENGYVVVYVD